MRAGRLLTMVLLLQDGRRLTARALAERLGVSERTVLRDLVVLSAAGIPVYGTRGPSGGFQMLDSFAQRVPPSVLETSVSHGRLHRVRVRISPTALQTALLTGRPEGWRGRVGAEPAPDRPDWLEGSFRFDSYETATRELVALGPAVEVLLPVEVRAAMAAAGRRIARLHRRPAS